MCGVIFGSLTYSMLLAEYQRKYPSLAYEQRHQDVYYALSQGIITACLGVLGFLIPIMLVFTWYKFYGFIWTTREARGNEAMRILRGEEKCYSKTKFI